MKKTIQRILTSVILFTIIWSCIPSYMYAATPQSPVRYHNSDGTVTNEKGEKTKSSSGKTTTSGTAGGGATAEDGGFFSMPDFSMPDFSAITKKFDKMLQTLDDLMSGKLIYDALTGVIIMFADDSVDTVYELFEKSFLFTPRVAEIVFVQDVWSITMIIGFIILAIGITFLAFSMIRGTRSPGPLLWNFFLCFVFSFLSLSLINMINVLVNGFTDVTLDSVLKKVEIDYSTIKGGDMLKSLGVGATALTDETFKEQTVMEILAGGKGGIFAMLSFLVAVILPYSLITVIKVIVMVGLAILSPFYISWSALTGKLDSVIGLANLLVRTLIAGYAVALSWGYIVKMQTATVSKEGFLYDFGIPTFWFACALCVFVSVLLYFQWIVPLWHAAKDPVTLAGGATLEGLGEAGRIASSFLGDIGDRFGVKGLQKQAEKWNEKSSVVAENGRRMKEEREKQIKSRGKKGRDYRHNLKNDPNADQYLAEPSDWIASEERIEDPDIDPVNFTGLSLKANGSELQQIMNAEGFSQQTMMRLSGENAAKFANWRASLPDKLKNQIQHYDPNTGQVTLGDNPEALLKRMKKEGIAIDQMSSKYERDGITVNGLNGNITTNGSEESQDALNEMQGKQGMYQKLDMPLEQAKEAFERAKKLGAGWVKDAFFDDEGLWVEVDDIDAARIDMGTERGTHSDVIEVGLPEGSRFMHQMLQDWEDSGRYPELMAAIETGEGERELYVREEQYEAFKTAYDQYRKGRQAFWTTKNGDVKVVRDGVPITYGSKPVNGMDMGRFEDFTKRRLKGELEPRRLTTKRAMDPSSKTSVSAPIVAPTTPVPVATTTATVPIGPLPKTRVPNGQKDRLVRGTMPGQKRPARLQGSSQKKMQVKNYRKEAPRKPTVVPPKSSKLPKVFGEGPVQAAGQKRPKKLQGRNQKRGTVTSQKQAAPIPAATPPVAVPSGSAKLPKALGEGPVQAPGQKRPARLQGRGQRPGKVTAQRSEPPPKKRSNEAQKKVAKEALISGTEAGVKAGVVRGASTYVMTGSRQQAVSQGAKAGVKAGAKAAQQKVQKDGAKAAIKDATTKKPK